jgi:hypothetical protein
MSAFSIGGARMRYLFTFRAAGTALAIAIACSGCASQHRPRDNGPGGFGRDSSMRMEGRVSSLNGSTLGIAGASGKAKIAITGSTHIFKLEDASLADVSTGKWLEARGERGASSSSFEVTSVRISDEPLPTAQAGESKGRRPEGAGGSGPSGGPQGGPQGGPPGARQGGAEGQRPPENGPNSGDSNRIQACIGKVESIDGHTITLSILGVDGKSKATILVDDDTTFVKLAKATTDALVSGAHVTVTGERNGDGELEARRIEIE